jgi:hypothetical protein
VPIRRLQRTMVSYLRCLLILGRASTDNERANVLRKNEASADCRPVSVRLKLKDHATARERTTPVWTRVCAHTLDSSPLPVPRLRKAPLSRGESLPPRRRAKVLGGLGSCLGQVPFAQEVSTWRKWVNLL